MKNNAFWIFIMSAFTLLQAQEGKVNNHIYEGNTQVEEEAYAGAEKSFRKALSMAPEKSTALYNLGNIHFLDKQYDEASQRFFQTQKFASSKEDKHKAFHNMGNVFMKKKEYQKAVEAYKNALRNNPSDDETRYNYALAKELLENEKPPEEQEQDDKKDQKDQQDQEKEEDQEKDNNDQKGIRKTRMKKTLTKKAMKETKIKTKGSPKMKEIKIKTNRTSKTKSLKIKSKLQKKGSYPLSRYRVY